MTYDIIPLPREKWKDHVLPIGYTTDRYYEVTMEQGDGFTVKLRERIADPPIVHTPEEYGFPDRLYEDHLTEAEAFGILRDGKLLAAIETCPESWGNRLRITELWVDESIRRQGVGRVLMDHAKAKAKREKYRALILETQSCNYNAIGFYLHEGFTLIGFDACCYANNDLERREVRIELGILFDLEGA